MLYSYIVVIVIDQLWLQPTNYSLYSMVDSGELQGCWYVVYMCDMYTPSPEGQTPELASVAEKYS